MIRFEAHHVEIQPTLFGNSMPGVEVHADLNPEQAKQLVLEVWLKFGSHLIGDALNPYGFTMVHRKD